MARHVDEETLGAQSARAARLHALTEYPEWAELVAAMAEREQLHASRLAKRIMRGSGVPQEEMLHHQGFWQGVHAVLRTPGAVEKRLKQMLDTAESAQQEGDR